MLTYQGYNGLRQFPFDVGKDRLRSEIKKKIGCLPENGGCIPSAVVIVTTAEKHPAFSGRHPKLFIISDLYRVVTEIAEVHADIARSFLNCIIPILP